ncbi:FMN-linked oxidoreductase [Dissoconium aciculare CBS 342.82]|uniref:tRNA-dihydrouridine(16/17) synthase [NAD(P)(+)] n=1 Tax=Dissoconium aciculare CBS 342.82 TaxID=1314786 RepID=A0A6J3LWY4_9PEZI|nr:FMN-linked oxidoreductase [Dissoconium aciculare CBS 342.82]KAF1819814.1 FMN-linked oxidoreductase [Dissoconium aciculare CBS 342.82]
MARAKLHGRAFYESIGSPTYILAPMVDQSEFAWRLLSRSFFPEDQRASLLAYSPMLHAKLFTESSKYRASHFEPLKPPHILPFPADANHQQLHKEEDLYLDGNPKIDRPLFVQFCANDPEAFLEAAKVVQPYCDAVDLNLGCPQGIARRGNYGAFLQEDWKTIHNLINALHAGLDIPVTAKFRIQETKEKTLEYAKMILAAGASIITVHGRQRHQKGHNTGLADWSVLRYLREKLPPETVIFANGNVLQHEDLQKCLDATLADGVMSAEANLYDPSIFATPPPAGEEGREYWRGRDGKGGYRCDAVLRRYLDIVHRHVLNQEPPVRQPLFLPSDVARKDEGPQAHPEISPNGQPHEQADAQDDLDGRPAKRQKREKDEPANQENTPSDKPDTKTSKKNGKAERCTNTNLTAMQAHCFHILRALVGEDTSVRDALARSRAGDLDAYENVLDLTEAAVKKGLLEYEQNPSKFEAPEDDSTPTAALPDPTEESADSFDPLGGSSFSAVRRCKRPFWICQSRVRPLPQEALEKGSLQLSKKEKKKLAAAAAISEKEASQEREQKENVGLHAGGTVGVEDAGDKNEDGGDGAKKVEVAKEELICG